MRALPTPSSLKWLINRRARLAGELTKIRKSPNPSLDKAIALVAGLEKQLEAAKRAQGRQVAMREQVIQALMEDLAATDMVLRQHEIQIDPDLISPVNGHKNKAMTDFGEMSRLIFEYLRLASGKSCTATEVTAYILASLDVDLTGAARSDARYRVRKRMQYMAWEGKLQRMPIPAGQLEGRWTLKSEIAS